MDTHRLWETFYVGSVPIVRQGEYPQALLDGSGLPYLSIENWSQLSSASTIERLEEISSNPTKVMDRLGIDFWLQKLDIYLGQKF